MTECQHAKNKVNTLYKKILHHARQIILFLGRLLGQRCGCFVGYIVSFFLLLAVLWVSRKLGNPTIEQFIFHIQYASEGLNDFDKKLLSNFFRHVVIGSVTIALLLLITERVLRPILRSYFSCNTVTRCAGKVWSFLSLLVLVLAAIIAYNCFGVADYLNADKHDDYIARHYVAPQSLSITPRLQKPKNLVLIYVESLEAVYSDATIFDKDLLAPLNDIAGIRFNDFSAVPGTGWTMAGIIASQCGVPLKPLAVIDGNRVGTLFKKFLPGATCLGDTLKQHGYTNVFMGGADLTFAGKDKFFNSHGYDQTYGKKDWLESSRYDQKDLNGWGLQDDHLFAEARLKLDALEVAGRPFNLTLLTVGTHFPHGFISKSCAQSGGKTFTDIVTCTAQDVAYFVAYMRQKGYLENTRVVIMGDHLTMPNDVYDKIRDLPHRSIYNLWVGDTALKQNRSNIIHFDIAPSILEFIGFKVPEGRYGLGYSGFADADIRPPPHRLEEMRQKLMNVSPVYHSLWAGKESY